METIAKKSRRRFLKETALAGAAVALTGTQLAALDRVRPVKNTAPRKAAVVWYRQAGHTARVGKLVAARWRKNGLEVTAADYRDLDPAVLAGADLIAAGSPVVYYEAPENFMSWIAGLPAIDGTAVASFVTFGGKGGNQHNACFGILKELAGRGGAPVGMGAFGNMSTFPPTWAMGNGERILKYRHLPDERTYEAVRAWADGVLARTREGRTVRAEGKFDFRQAIRGGFSIGGTKLLMKGFTIDPKTCIGCGTCVEKCPVGAVDLEKHRMDSRRCLACMGCVNNCPVGAVRMSFWGRPLTGFKKFLKDNGVAIREPRELEGSS